MLVPSEHQFNILSLGYSGSNHSFHGMNPLSHLMQDFFLKAELDAVLRLFWPLPNPEHIMALKPFVHARVRYLTGRHAVSRFLWTANCRGGAQISHAL